MATKKLGATQNGEATIPSSEQAVEAEKVEVQKDKLDAVLSLVEKQQQEIEILKSIASETRYKEAEANVGKDTRSRVHFKKLQGKVVVGWPDKGSPDKRNEIVINPTTNIPVGEVLRSKFYFLDGTTSDMLDQMELTRSTDLVFARVVEDLGSEVAVEFEDQAIFAGKFIVNKKFLNA